MRLLFTGATGFVGSHIREEIDSDGNEILFLINEGEQLSPKGKNSSVISADMKDLSGVRSKIVDFNPEACLHCAWQGIPDYSEKISKINLENSISLVDLLFKETGCKKLVVSGSCSEYGKSHGICREGDPTEATMFFSWAKQSLYSYSKLIADNVSASLVWLRMFYVYGPGQRQGALIPSLVRSLKNKEMPKIKKPFNKNDFVYIGDAAKAYRAALEGPVRSGIYNIGSGKATKVIDVCRAVEKKLADSDNFTKEIQDKGDRTTDIDFYADVSKARKEMRWEASTGMEEGVSLYLKSTEDKK